jgi:hypothetical protein
MQFHRFSGDKLQLVTFARLSAVIAPDTVAQSNQALGQDLEGMPHGVLGYSQQAAKHGFSPIKQFAAVAAIEERCADPLSAQASQAYQHSFGFCPVLSACRIASTLLRALGGRVLESSSRGVPACAFDHLGWTRQI